MNYIRTLVSGKKRRYIDDNYNLDLSYITPRIIAMAYPASGLQTMYRNNISTVSKFLIEKHKSNYYVFNLSGKKYDNSKFQNRVLEYEWVDHHAPPLKILFNICQEIHKFLNDKIENIVAVNCMAGKGRTGTIICCYLLFCGRFEKADDAFDYYSKKRFSVGEGVTQPSQKRYVYYFEKILREKIFFPYLLSIVDISFNKFPHKKKNSLKPYFEIYLENNDKLAYSNKVNYINQKEINTEKSIDWVSIYENDFKFHFSGDVTIKIFNNKKFSNKKICRVALNSAFLDYGQNELIFNLDEIDPDNLVNNKKIPKDMKMKISFLRMCDCNNRVFPVILCDICSKFVKKELSYWIEIQEILDNHNSNKEKGNLLLFGDKEDDVEKVIQADISEFEDEEDKKQREKENLNNSFEGDCKVF